ncbi:hypothetical protein Tco_1269388 [Tanacetum coccineum]
MIDRLSIVETDKRIHTVETDIVKLVVEFESFGMSFDEFDKETVSVDELQLRQADLSCVHALNELHLHKIRVVPSINDVSLSTHQSSKKASTTKETSRGKAPTKGSKAGKSAIVEESVEEPITEVVMDDVVNNTVEDVVLVDDAPEEPWFINLLSTEKDPLTFDELIATLIDFSKFVKNHLKIDKLTNAHLVRPVYKLLKGTCKSSIELDYNMEECFKALTDKLDWNNTKGDRCPFDLIKPLPMKGRPGRLTVATKDFFNNDLEFLKSSDPVKKCTMSITKTKAARYEIMGIEDMVHTLWSATKVRYDKDAEKGIKHWVPSVSCERYQKKLNLNKPQNTFLGIEFKELYTPSFDPPGVIFEDLYKQKRVMRADELYKFSDGTFKTVRDELHHRQLNFRLEYNDDMPKRKWSAMDKRRSGLMVDFIDKQMLERRIIRNLERLVGARKLEMDYRLLTRTE